MNNQTSKTTFNVKENEAIGFDSKWIIKKITLEDSAQTHPINYNDKETNAIETKEIEVQTDEDQVKAVEYNEERLAAWLTQIYPQIIDELDTNSSAINNYHPYNNENNEYGWKLIKNIKINEPNSGDIVLSISGLSWNCTGNVLAVSFNYPHASWCHHATKLLLFTYDRSGKMLEDHPQNAIQIDNCVMVIKFHPFLPSVIACGTYSGEILIWNVQSNDELLCKVNGHEEQITQINWINDITAAKTLLLITSSLDGFLNLWNFNAKQLIIKEKFKIKAPMFGRNQRKNASLPNEIAMKCDRGILAFDFSKFVPDMFVAAAEGGIIAQCSLLGAKQLKGWSESCPISDPIYKYYETNEGETTNIQFSPNRKEMFLTNATNGEIRIYLLGQDEPAQVIFIETPLIYANWVPYQEKLLIGCGSKGTIEIIDVINGIPLQNAITDKLEERNLLQIDINMKHIQTIASGSSDGYLQLWKIPWNSINL